ncbi:predicted protein [Naegleria gruberi]|uniref:Predicted protein n=1 Tax=Naegleria gruberi TaxID=5762 RepID=D2V838_NAEGR|nr:uncharacterized protein NAEGRDRAFT_65018 [Naegleria gruberi]EFC46976.1 predicted protein [Naegleria gruberi]|eukprot:XP_002679720.1 predicted protein [Naegleria gruberi strain NEG-M]
MQQAVLGGQFQTPSKLFPLLMNSGEEFSNYDDEDFYRDDAKETTSSSRPDMTLLNSLKEWINVLVGLDLVEIKTQNPLQSFLNCFKDGVLLCRIVEKIKLKHITFNKHPGGKEVVERENFQTFLKVSHNQA